MNMDAGKDLLVFADEKKEETRRPASRWKILIVDDELDVHKVTRLVLSGFEFGGRTLELYSAYSAAEARELLGAHPDMAVILLDVVMEDDDAGLKLVRHIREEQHNNAVRIILRTGQPGQAPEQKVVLQYDINDYKAKTELTSEKLFTTVIASLRAYRDIITIEKSRKGLEKIIDASASIFELQSLKTFVNGILTQFVSMLQFDVNAVYGKTSGLTAVDNDGKIYVVAGTGIYSGNIVEREISEVLAPEIMGMVNRAIDTRTNIYDGVHYVGYFQSKTGHINILYLERNEPLEDWERNMVEILCSNVSIAFENIYLNQELEHIIEERTTQLREANQELSQKNAGIKRELEMAQRVQMSFLPSVFPQSDVIRFSGRYMPMQDLGGDFYDVFHLGPNKFGVVIADVSGHGASASLVTAMVKMFFTETSAADKRPDQVINEVHRNMLNTVGHSGIFITVFYGIIDTERMVMEYVNAGHAPGILLSADGGMSLIESNATIVGAFRNAEYGTLEMPLRHGDTLVLFTDGLPEAKSADGGIIGSDPFYEMVKKCRALPVEEMSQAILDAVNSCSADSQGDDDKTILIAALT